MLMFTGPMEIHKMHVHCVTKNVNLFYRSECWGCELRTMSTVRSVRLRWTTGRYSHDRKFLATRRLFGGISSWPARWRTRRYRLEVVLDSSSRSPAVNPGVLRLRDAHSTCWRRRRRAAAALARWRRWCRQGAPRAGRSTASSWSQSLRMSSLSVRRRVTSRADRYAPTGDGTSSNACHEMENWRKSSSEILRNITMR